ncbi:Outer membrane protein (OmpH-like) [Cardinium endosymbiont of Sogatella furcifera]|uniref:OmpH family outer membrane protein n=1 Tax=Cardinium endosymbiont of Sogatella furcifera TaxID=650378 RepID=UPI000E0CDA25|nr:OmpH family outer membrane protein [Cardinium endosymbiont of Sogatella furcifera]AXI24558.1 Outer membrane protein (OmpH-like) [Cardinium endosymbiont of Sogatella furcifera]
MNYKFLATWALLICMGTNVKADGSPKVIEQPQVVSSSLKLGYVDMSSILDNLTEAQKNECEIKSFQKQLDKQIQEKYAEFQKAVATFQEQVNTLTEAQKKQKYTEVYNLEAAVHELQDQRPAKMAEKCKVVMQPLYDKIQAVIEEIKTEHAYHFVFSKHTDAGPVVLAAGKEYNLTPLVLKKLEKMAPKEAQPPVVGLKAQPPAKVAKPSVKKK